MIIKRVLNDSVLVKIKRDSGETKTKSGIFIVGTEQDFYIAEVIMVGPGNWEVNKETGKEEFIPVTMKTGDMIILEKNFSHVYDVRHRDRVDHTIEIAKGEGDFDFFLTKAKDCYLKFDNPEDAKDTEVFGELYSILTVKKSVQHSN